MPGFGAALPAEGLDLATLAGDDQDQNLPQQAPQGAAQPLPSGGPGMEGQTQATPEEQDQYERFIGRALQLVYDDKMLPRIVDMLDGGSGEGAQGDPVEGLAQTAATVIGRVANAADKSGTKLSKNVLLHAGGEVFSDLANLSKVTKVKDYTQDPEAFQKAYLRTLDIFHGMLQGAGEVDQESAKSDLAKMQSMDQAGELEPMFMRLAQSDAGRSAQNDNSQPPVDESAPPPKRGLGG